VTTSTATASTTPAAVDKFGTPLAVGDSVIVFEHDNDDRMEYFERVIVAVKPYQGGFLIEFVSPYGNPTSTALAEDARRLEP